MKKTRYLFWLLPVLTACTTLNKAVVSNPSLREGLQDLNLSASYDVYQLRVDLIRNITTEIDANNATTTEEVPYHYLGVNLGNGLFYDANHNLTLNLNQLPELQDVTEFTIVRRERGTWQSPTVFTKYDHSFIKKGEGLFSNTFKASVLDSTVVIDPGFLSGKKNIRIQDSCLYYDGGLFDTRLQRLTDRILLSEFLHKEEYRQDENKVYLDKHYLIEDKGNVIEITDLRSWGTSKYFFIKTGNSYYFFDEHYRGVKITVQDREILVETNGRETSSFVVENKS